MTERDRHEPESRPPDPPVTGLLATDDLEGLDARQTGEQLFLDSLLRRLYVPELARGEERLAKAMTAVRADAARERQRRSRGRMLFLVVTSAAAVLVVALVLSLPGREVRAASPLNVLRQAIARMEEATDREYRVSVTHRESPFSHQLPHQATIWVGGSRGFAIRIPFQWAEVWMGFDGEEWWMIPPMPGAPVLVSSETPRPPSAISGERQPPMDLERFFDVATLGDVTGMLRLLENDYDLEFVTRRVGDEEQVRVLGTLRSELPMAADTVEFEADQNGVIRVMVMSWEREMSTFAPRSLLLELVSTQPRPVSWYAHEGHHAPGLPVRRLENR